MHNLFHWMLILAVVLFYGFGALALSLPNHANAAAALEEEDLLLRTGTFMSPVKVVLPHRPYEMFPDSRRRRVARAALYTHVAAVAFFAMGLISAGLALFGR